MCGQSSEKILGGGGGGGGADKESLNLDFYVILWTAKLG